jgi:DNA invertase Pin-like site-specific DNA recombinase
MTFSVGYARVSTDGQTLDAQIEQLTQAGCAKIFSEKESGVRTDRPQLARAIEVLDKGDVLIVTRLDRLARSTLDLLNTLDAVAKRKAAFRSIKDQWCDTTTPHGKLMITILGGLAEFERSLILARTNEGRERAKANGVAFGPKHKLSDYQITEAKRLREQGQSQVQIGKLLGVSYRTVGRALDRD